MNRKMPKWMKSVGEAARGRASDAGVALKKGGDAAAARLGEAKRDMDLKRLRPIMMEQVESGEYAIPALLQVIDFDKRQANPVCADAIGFGDVPNKMNMFSLLRSYIGDVGIKLLPSANEMLYYIHPFDERCYIGLDHYFLYLQKSRVAELERIAYDLGAKYAKISIMEEQSSIINKQIKAKVGGRFRKEDGAINIAHDLEEKKFINARVEQKIQLNGNDEPKRPELVFYKDEPDIKNLIEMRLNDPSSIKSKTYLLKYNARDGIKETEAAQIDGVLKQLKINGNASLKSAAEQEARLMLEYTIEF